MTMTANLLVAGPKSEREEEYSSERQWRTQEFFSGGGVQQIQLRTERTGIWGRQPLVRGSGGSCNLVQEI